MGLGEGSGAVAVTLAFGVRPLSSVFSLVLEANGLFSRILERIADCTDDEDEVTSAAKILGRILIRFVTAEELPFGIWAFDFPLVSSRNSDTI